MQHGGTHGFPFKPTFHYSGHLNLMPKQLTFQYLNSPELNDMATFLLVTYRLFLKTFLIYRY